MAILRPSYLHNGISCTGKTISLYWIGPLMPTNGINGSNRSYNAAQGLWTPFVASLIARFMGPTWGPSGAYFPDSKVHGANMGPLWGLQDPGGPHVGPMNLAIWSYILTCLQINQWYPYPPRVLLSHCGHHEIAPMPMKQSSRISLNELHLFTTLWQYNQWRFGIA